MLNSVRVCLGLEWLRHYRWRRKSGHIQMGPGMQGRDLLGVSERALSWLSRQHPFTLSCNLTNRRAERSDLECAIEGICVAVSLLTLHEMSCEQLERC